MVSRIVLETFASALVLFGFTLPLGLVTLRLLSVECSALARIAIAGPLGLAIAVSALALELAIGAPGLTLGLALGSIFVLVRPRGASWSLLPALTPDILTALALGSLALLANAGDVLIGPGGLSVRVGFDVSDRAFYGTVAQELERAPIWRLENPGFAPLPLQYSYLPALAGVLVHRYAGVDPLICFGTTLPFLGIFEAALAAAALAQALGASTRLGRLLPAALVVLGGDLSFLVPRINETWLERTRHFFVFYSFSGESLFYNPWMFGVPILIGALVCLSLMLKGAEKTQILPAAILLAALFQAKVFAFIPLWLSVIALGLHGREVRLLGVAVGSVLLAAPGVLLVLVSGAARGGAPLGVEPFAFLHDAVAANPSLTDLGLAVGFPVAAVVVLLGGFGFRLLGLGTLIGGAAKGASGARVCAVVSLLSLLLALILVGRPTRLDGIQFLVVPQVLLWIFAGGFLAERARQGGLSRIATFLILALCVLGPARYILFKSVPSRFVAPDTLDARRFLLSPETVEASRWLRGHSHPTDRLVMTLSGDPEDRGGLKPTYVGLLASRRLVAQATAFSVSAPLARERQAAVERLFEATDTGEGEALLDALGAAWVVEVASRPLRFPSDRLMFRAAFGDTRLLSVVPAR